MNKTIKTVLTIVLAMLSLNGFAQKIAIQAGYVNSKETNSDAVNGLQVGPTAELSVQNNIGIQYGVLYTFLTKTEPGIIGTNTYTGHLIDIPVRLKVDFPIDNKIKIFAFGGPNFNIGLAQNIKNITNILGSEVITNIDYYKIDADNNNQYDLNRFDMQLGIGGGLQYKNVQLKVGYDWGLFDLNNTTNISYTRNQLTASIGFIL